MAKGDIRLVRAGGHSNVPTMTWQTEAAATAILAGEPVKFKSAGSPYAIPLADADLTIGTDTQMLGIAASAGTHTASADGVVEVYMPLPGTVWGCNAKTSSTADTDAEIAALVGDRVVIDLTSSTYTLDAAAGDGATNALYIVGGDAKHSEIHFMIRLDATFLSGESV